MLDERIVKFIKRHHVLTLATTDEQGMPYVANCFYAYDKERNLFVVTSDTTTRHGGHMEKRTEVALSIVLETRIVGRIEGLQVCATAERGDDKARSCYIKRFPYAAVAPLSPRASSYDYYSSLCHISFVPNPKVLSVSFIIVGSTIHSSRGATTA